MTDKLHYAQTYRSYALAFVATAIACFIAQIAISSNKRSENNDSRPTQKVFQTPNEVNLDFGQMAKGSKKEIAFVISIETKESIRLVESKSSCKCFSVSFEEKPFVAGMQIKGIARVDFSNEPEFVGSLLVTTDLVWEQDDSNRRKHVEIKAKISVIQQIEKD